MCHPGYDNIYELLSATQGANTTESYTYDPVGNRLSNLSGSGWSNNTSNELTSRPGVTYTYDNNGNTLTKTDSTGTTNYTWDFENRLTSVTLPGNGGTVSFKYDPFGRRTYKSSSAGTSVFAFDGDNLIEETNASGGVVARYSQGLNIDEPLAMLRSGATSYYQADGVGSVTSLSNGAGAVAQNYTYDSFGNVIASSGSVVNNFRYTAREFDTETGLYYYRARYYDPTSGRFITEDPLGFRAGLNKYAYVSNSTVDFRDPRGLCKEGLLSCAGSLSQSLTLNAISPVRIPLLGSNFFGDVATAFSPGPVDEQADALGSAATEVAAHAIATTAPHIAIGTVSSIGLPVSATSGVYNPITLGETTATLGGAIPEIAAAAEVFLGVAELKLAIDAGVFLAALGYCAFH